MGSNCISKFSRVQKTNVQPIQAYAPTQKALNNLQFETELPNPRQLNYWRRKLNKVCGQNCPNIPQQKFIELFNYSEMKQESLKKLYLIFKNQNELSNNVFQSKLKNIGSDSDQQLAQVIHYIYFVNSINLQNSLNLFYIQLKNFIKEKPNQKVTSSAKSSLDSNQEFSQKQKKKLVDSLHSSQTIYDNRFTYDWIRKNIDLRKFKYHLMEGNFKNDEMDAYKHFYHDRYTSQSRLGLVKGNQNQKLIIINWKWCEKMLQYMQSKYQIEGAPKIKKRQTLPHNSTLFDSKNLMFSKRTRNGSRVLDKIEPIQVPDLSLVTVKQKVTMNTSAIHYFPDQIQNNYLIGDFRHELKRNIRKNVDYTAINQSTYDKLQLVFGGGPKIIRKVIQGYIQLRPFFIKSFYLKRDQNTNMQTLIEKQLIVISSFKPVNDFVPSQYKNYVCYHRNVGDQWNKFPFENLDKNIKIIDALTQTSFLIYVKSENQNDFKKRYIERGKKFCLGDIYSSRTYKFMDSTQERMSFNDQIQVCIINDQQEAFVQVTVLNWSHNIQRKIRTQQFQENFTLVSKQNRILKGDRRGGIANLGNTCYMSSAIQAILSTIKQEYLNKGKGKLGIQLLELAKKLQKRKSVSPVDFKTTFDNYFQDFKGQEQHDAHQFCLRLFQQLQIDNKPLIQNILDLKLNFVSKCTKCQNKIQRIIPDFVVSVPIVDFAKRQVKIDYIINNLNIQTVQFTVKEDCTIDDWRRSFQKVSGAQNYYLCQVDDCRIKKTFNKQDCFQSLLFKDLNIQTHQLITAYQLTNYEFKTAKINNKYKFAVFKDSKERDGIIARVEAYEQEDSNNTSIERSLNGQRTERKCQILIQNESSVMENKVVSQSQLLRFPQDLSNKQIYVKLINFDNTYGQRIGRPFIFKLPSHQPIQAIRLALQNCIGNRGYILRLSPSNQISKCSICKQYSCSTSCFISRQDHAPICWVQGKLQFVVAWYNGFQYNSLIKRTKWVGSNSQINSNQFDSFQQSIKKYQQKEKLQLSLCQKCKQRNVEAQCRTLVNKWPDFLIIQIKRFSIKVDQIYKIHTKWKLEQSLIINKQKYNLKAVICHIGQSAECGHYVTISNGLLYDDQVVTQKRYEDIPPQYIYMLFYHKEA